MSLVVGRRAEGVYAIHSVLTPLPCSFILTQKGVADVEDNFEREACGFTFKIIPPGSNAPKRIVQGLRYFVRKPTTVGGFVDC